MATYIVTINELTMAGKSVLSLLRSLKDVVPKKGIYVFGYCFIKTTYVVCNLLFSDKGVCFFYQSLSGGRSCIHPHLLIGF